MIHELIHTYLLIFLIVFPIISTIIVYYVSNFFFKHQWKAIHFTVQWTASFYIIAVVLLLEKFLNQTIIGTVLIILITVLAIILIFQWKHKTEVILRNGLKVLSRISFLVFGIIYLLLISYEIVSSVYINYLD